MGMEEVAPAELRATASRRHAGLPEDRGDRRRRDTPADACQLADNPLVTPAWIFTRQTQN